MNSKLKIFSVSRISSVLVVMLSLAIIPSSSQQAEEVTVGTSTVNMTKESTSEEAVTPRQMNDCGVPTKNNKYPWIVAIYDTKQKLACTATIITMLHVLTADNCFGIDYKVSVVSPEQYTIIAGKHYSNIHRSHKSAQVRKIKHSIIHQNHVDLSETYRYEIDKYDMVLIEVDEPFTFNDDVLPACLDWNNFYDATDFTDGNEAIAVGWTHDQDEVVPCDQDQFNVQYWQFSTCKENLNHDATFTYILDSGKFCTTYTGDTFSDKKYCGINRGVGLFFKSTPWRYYFKGVTSFWTLPSKPTDITFVTYYKVNRIHHWLKDHIRKHPSLASAFDDTHHKYQPVTGCRLPEHIKYGSFRLILGKAYRVNMWVPSETKISLYCAGNRDEAPVTIGCSLGAWIPSIDKLECKRPGSCPALASSESEDISCKLNGQEVSCADSEDNTTAIVRCKPFHIISGNKPIYKCHDGKWDQSFTRCTLECGTKRVGVTTLTIGGSETIKNEYPWVVAIYRSTELVCSGTLISRKYVLSAAHCFTDSNGSPIDKDIYTIIAGKYYANISEVEPSAQSKKIRSMHIHNDYKGKLVKHRDDIAVIELDTEVTPSWEVQPACLDWDSEYEDFDFEDGNNGVVTGWGNTNATVPSPSTVLRKLVIPFRPRSVCIKNLPKDFSDQYVAADKICAGYEDNDKNVCSGDSGGGLYFKSGDNRFYVRGIVSLTVKNDVGGCRSNKFALYTKVSRYLSWIETITRRVL